MILKDCVRCFVYMPDGRIAASGRVNVVGEHIFLYFQEIANFRDARVRASVEFFDSIAGIVRAGCELLIQENRYYGEMVEPWMARCRILKVDKIVQRQKDPRVRTELEVAAVSLDYGPFVGVVRNISAGGVYLTTDQRMEERNTFVFSHTFFSERCRLEASVVWLKTLPDKGYGYGCQFIRLEEAAKRDIQRYVTMRLAKQGKQDG